MNETYGSTATTRPVGPVMTCLYCGGVLGYLGTLGRMLWLRCRDCGLSHALPVCPVCEGQPDEYDEGTDTVECCTACDGSGLRLERTKARGQ